MYSKTKGFKCAYNNESHDEFFDIDELIDDANKEIAKRDKVISQQKRKLDKIILLLNDYDLKTLTKNRLLGVVKHGF